MVYAIIYIIEKWWYLDTDMCVSTSVSRVFIFSEEYSFFS